MGASLGVEIAGSFADATHVVFWIISGLGAAIVVLGLATTSARAKASAERVAFLLVDVPPEPEARPQRTSHLLRSVG